MTTKTANKSAASIRELNNAKLIARLPSAIKAATDACKALATHEARADNTKIRAGVALAKIELGIKAQDKSAKLGDWLRSEANTTGFAYETGRKYARWGRFELAEAGAGIKAIAEENAKRKVNMQNARDKAKAAKSNPKAATAEAPAKRTQAALLADAIALLARLEPDNQLLLAEASAKACGLQFVNPEQAPTAAPRKRNRKAKATVAA